MQELVAVQIYYLLHEEKYLQKKSFCNNAVKIKHIQFLPLFVVSHSQLLWVLWSGFCLGANPGVSQRASASGVLCREERDVHAGGFFFLTPGHFYMSANAPLYLFLFSWIFSSVSWPDFLYMVALRKVNESKGTISFTPKTSFVQLQLCLSLRDCGWMVCSCGVSCARLCPSLTSRTCTPHCTPVARVSLLLCFCALSVSLYCIFGLVVFRCTQNNCCPCKPMAVPYRVKQTTHGRQIHQFSCNNGV